MPLTVPRAPSRTYSVLGVPINAVDYGSVVSQISEWGRASESRCVCICNVHSIVTASRDPAFMAVLAAADLATPDGAPVAWMLRWQGERSQARVSGPDLLLEYCAHAAASGESIYLFGSTDDTLRRLRGNLAQRYPGLQIAGWHAPPFRELSSSEDDAVVRDINASGASTLWVSLGCPKQERWMAAHRDRVRMPMIGVGAAFDFNAGAMLRAPLWMRDHGLEWLHRLAHEPGRLWKRYLVTNTLFVIGALRQVLAARGAR